MQKSNLFSKCVIVASLSFLSACADQFLDAAEGEISNRTSFGPTSSLVELSALSRNTSIAYRNAAKNTTSLQDVQSFLIFLAAGYFVKGSIGSASDAVLANRAIAGASIQQIGLRTAPRSSILGMYTGAKRLNCLSTVLRVGSIGLDGKTAEAASVVAFGAIEEVRITTRESLVRSVADYSALVTSITPAKPGAPRSLGQDDAIDETLLTKFSTDVAACLAKAV